MKLENKLSRRGFVLKSLGSAAVLTGGTEMFSANAAFDNSSEKRYLKPISGALDPIIPFEFFPKLENEMVSYIIDLRKRYGFRRFLLTGPSKENRYTGFPEKQVFRDMGELILKVKQQVSSYDIEIGWWCITTIRIGNGRFQGIIRSDGSQVKEACCPLDLNFRAAFSDYVGTVVEIAKPFLVNFEDDFHLNGGCFCPLHLEEFGKRQNRHYTREELNSIINLKKWEDRALIDAWNILKKDSLTDFATSVRTKVDTIFPETRLSLCENHGQNERDGNCTESVTRAFAGHTKPIVRLQGSSYSSDLSLNLPSRVFGCLYQKQHLPSDFELIHEADSFPHNRFFMSSSKLKSLMTAAFAYGLHDSLLYTTQYLENPLEEDGYSEMFQKESGRFFALKKAVEKCEVEGCEIFQKPGYFSNWVHIAGRMGIPYTSTGGNVKLVSGDVIETMSEGEIVNLLKGNVFLDGYAGHLLTKKGYGRMIGGEVVSREEIKAPPFYEAVRNPESYENIKNRLMYNYVWAFNSGTKDAFYQIKPLNDAKIITDFVNSQNQPFYPGMIRFENQFGGRIATMAFNLNDQYVYSSDTSMFNYSKKELIRQTIEWLGKESLPVFVRQIPNAFCIFNKATSNDYAIVVVMGLSSDSFETFSLDLSPEWVNSQFELLSDNGRWGAIKTKKNNRTVEFRARLALMDPIVLKLSKRA